MEDFELIDADNLFTTDEETTEETPKNKPSETNKETEETTEVNPDELFGEPESVGSGKQNKEEREEDTTSTKESTSPETFYSSIANALVEDGVTPDLDVSKITDAESFAEAIKAYYEGRLDETQKRINDALNNGVEPSQIKFYENTIKNLNSITDEFLENEDNEDFRKRAIYQDLINRGYSKEEAEEEVNEILEAGTDLKKTKRAESSMKEFYNRKYKELLDEAKEQTAQEEKEQKAKMESLKKDLLDGNTSFGDLELTKEDRQKAFDAITKPIWRDPETGEYFTAIQKYERDNREDFMKKLAITYVMTNGFESLDKIVKNKVNKESKKALRELESKLSNTRRTSDGNLTFAGGNNDTESMFRGYSLDI